VKNWEAVSAAVKTTSNQAERLHTKTNRTTCERVTSDLQKGGNKDSLKKRSEGERKKLLSIGRRGKMGDQPDIIGELIASVKVRRVEM